MSEGNLTGNGAAGLQDSWLPPPVGPLPATSVPALRCRASGMKKGRTGKKEEWVEGLGLAREGVREGHLHTGPGSPVTLASAQLLLGPTSAVPETNLLLGTYLSLSSSRAGQSWVFLILVAPGCPSHH